jgi:hypothetical protein
LSSTNYNYGSIRGQFDITTTGAAYKNAQFYDCQLSSNGPSTLNVHNLQLNNCDMRSAAAPATFNVQCVQNGGNNGVFQITDTDMRNYTILDSSVQTDRKILRSRLVLNRCAISSSFADSDGTPFDIDHSTIISSDSFLIGATGSPSGVALRVMNSSLSDDTALVVSLTCTAGPIRTAKFYNCSLSCTGTGLTDAATFQTSNVLQRFDFKNSSFSSSSPNPVVFDAPAGSTCFDLAACAFETVSGQSLNNIVNVFNVASGGNNSSSGTIAAGITMVVAQPIF